MLKVSSFVGVVLMAFLLVPSSHQNVLSCIGIGEGRATNKKNPNMKGAIWSGYNEIKPTSLHPYNSYPYASFKEKNITKLKITAKDIYDNQLYMVNFETQKDSMKYAVCTIVNVYGRDLKAGISFDDLEKRTNVAAVNVSGKHKRMKPGSLLLEFHATKNTKRTLIIEAIVFNQIGEIDINKVEIRKDRSFNCNVSEILGISHNQGSKINDFLSWTFN